jgi:hypothetical protein
LGLYMGPFCFLENMLIFIENLYMFLFNVKNIDK